MNYIPPFVARLLGKPVTGIKPPVFPEQVQDPNSLRAGLQSFRDLHACGDGISVVDPLGIEDVHVKTTASAVGAVNDRKLGNHGTRILLLSGVRDDDCVCATAVEAASNGYHAVVILDHVLRGTLPQFVPVEERLAKLQPRYELTLRVALYDPQIGQFPGDDAFNEIRARIHFIDRRFLTPENLQQLENEEVGWLPSLADIPRKPTAQICNQLLRAASMPRQNAP